MSRQADLSNRQNFIRSLTRRKFIKYASTASLAVATAKLTSCASQPEATSQTGGSSSKGGILRILTWSGYDDPTVIDKFKQQTGAKVEFKTYVGGEQMLQFFSQSPPGTFDGIISDGEYVPKLIALNAIEPLNPDNLPEYKNYHQVYQNFSGFFNKDKMMGIGTRFGNYGVAFNTKYIKAEEVGSWNMLLREDLRGKVALFDWYLPNMGNASLAVFPNKENPYDLTDAELQQVKDWLLKLKPNVAVISPNFQDVTNAFVSESVTAGPIGDWLIQNVVADGHANFMAVVPKEGGVRWSEAATLCAASKNKELTLEWVKYMSLPETQARLANVPSSKGLAPNLKAVDYMSDTEKKLLGYIPAVTDPGKTYVEVSLERTVARQLPKNQSEKVWQDIYNEFKTS